MAKIRANLTRKAIRKAAKMPPQKMATQSCLSQMKVLFYCLESSLTFGLDISPPSQMPVVSLIISGGHPARARGVENQPPVMAPMPVEYERPTSVRKKPLPTPVAVLMVAGMALMNHWRMPVRARKMKMSPSRKTAVRAVSYEMEPLPFTPTTCMPSVW